MLTLRYPSLFLLISLLYVSSSQAMGDVPLQNLTPKICNNILLNPKSNLKTCEVCLRQVLRTSLPRDKYVQTLKASQRQEILSPGAPQDDTLAEKNPTLGSQISEPESSEPSHEDTAIINDSTPVTPGAALALPTENEGDRAPLPQSIGGASEDSFEPVISESVVESPGLPSLSAESTNIVPTPQLPGPIHETPSKEPASPILLSSHEVRALQDHLPDPVLQRTRAVQAAENSISSLMENVRGDSEKITTLRENIEKNKAIIAGKIPLPKGATLKGLQSRIELDIKNIEKQENHIQNKTKEVETLKEKTEKLQGEIHAILKGDKAKGVLASRYASKLEGKQGDIVRKQATHDLSILAYNEAQQAYAASTGVSFGFVFPVEQQMKNQRLVDHLFSLAEQLREDDPDNDELADKLDLQAQRLKDITPLSHQKKSPELKHKKSKL